MTKAVSCVDFGKVSIRTFAFSSTQLRCGKSAVTDKGDMAEHKFRMEDSIATPLHSALSHLDSGKRHSASVFFYFLRQVVKFNPMRHLQRYTCYYVLIGLLKRNMLVVAPGPF